MAEKLLQFVTLAFSGVKTREMAKRFFTYLVDGGLEDLLIDRLSGGGITLEINGCDKRALTVDFKCSKEKPVKKKVPAVKKALVKKKPKKAEKIPGKPVVKKAPAKRPKKG